MAPTFKSARCTTVLMDGFDMSQILNDSSVNASVNTADTTTYATSTGGCQPDKTFIPTLVEGTLSMSGMVDFGTTGAESRGVDRGAIEAVLASTTKQRVTYGPGGSTVGSRAYLINGDVTSYNITAPVADLIGMSADVQASNRRAGWWLISPGASRTAVSTGFATVTDRGLSTAGGSTPAGGTAHLHVVSVTTSTGQVKVQHSTDGTAWADLVTLSFSSGRSAQRSTVAGSVKEKLRGTLPAITAGGARIGLAFARNLPSTY
jgi:hypothetical protein